MIDFLKNLFGKAEKSDAEDPGGNAFHDIHIAACALLLEMSAIDGEFSETERTHILAILKKRYQLTDENAAALLEAANEERENSTDLWRFASLINRNYSIEEKEGIIETIWTLAYADGHLDKHENYLVHKLAKLLRLSHEQLIAAKLRVISG